MAPSAMPTRRRWLCSAFRSRLPRARSSPTSLSIATACSRWSKPAGGGGGDRRELRLRRRDGSEAPVEVSARALEYGGAACLVYSIFDLTEKKAAEAEIERQRTMIHHSEKLGALGSLLAGVAHELNNPLSVVVAQSGLLAERAADADMAARGKRIQAAAERCARIVKTFLA